MSAPVWEQILRTFAAHPFFSSRRWEEEPTLIWATHQTSVPRALPFAFLFASSPATTTDVPTELVRAVAAPLIFAPLRLRS